MPSSELEKGSRGRTHLVVIEREAGPGQSRQSSAGHAQRLSSSLAMKISSSEYYEQDLHSCPSCRGEGCTDWPPVTLVAKASVVRSHVGKTKGVTVGTEAPSRDSKTWTSLSAETFHKSDVKEEGKSV